MRKIGRILIDSGLLETPELAEALAQIKFVPVRVNYLYEYDVYEMVGLSERFDELQKGEKFKEYRLDIDQDGKAQINYER